MSPTSSSQEDVILPIMNDYMQQIVRGEKNHEFRKYRMPASVARIWFYLNAPYSHIAYVCEVDPARTRGPTTTPENDDDINEKLAEDGLGNKEFNEHHPDWIGYDYAYRIKSVYKLRVPVTLAMLKTRYGFKAAPRSRVYLPPRMAADIVWSDQERLFPVPSPPTSALQEEPPQDIQHLTGKRKVDDSPPPATPAKKPVYE